MYIMHSVADHDWQQLPTIDPFACQLYSGGESGAFGPHSDRRIVSCMKNALTIRVDCSVYQAY